MDILSDGYIKYTMYSVYISMDILSLLCCEMTPTKCFSKDS